MKTIAIIGRPNVGKSTLFNRLIGERKAVVSKKPGITRDRIYGWIKDNDKVVLCIDTGGITFEDIGISKEVMKQVKIAIEEANEIIFLVDYKTGIHPLDEDIAAYLRKNNIEPLLVVNKVDNFNEKGYIYEFSKLGFKNIVPISATHNRGIGEIISIIAKGVKEEKIIKNEIKIAVVGKPNVGKSSLVNAILGKERSIVTSAPGTTRDSIDTPFEYNGEKFLLIDTAGLRRKSRIKEDIEYYTLIRAIKSIRRASLVFFIIDSSIKISRQDKRIISELEEAKRGIIIVLHKSDIISQEKRKEVINYYKRHLHFAEFAPMIYTSARTGEGIKELLDLAITVHRNKLNRVSKKKLLESLRQAYLKMPPPLYGRKRAKIIGVEQKGPCTILIQTNIKNAFSSQYIRYLRNQLYKDFEFTGIPLDIKIEGSE